MKNNNFKLKFNLTEPETGKSKASLDLGFVNHEEKVDRVIMKDEHSDPIIIQEESKKSKGLVIDFLSKLGSLNLDFNSKHKK